jgi:hypothetical protein
MIYHNKARGAGLPPCKGLQALQLIQPNASSASSAITVINLGAEIWAQALAPNINYQGLFIPTFKRAV